MQIILNEKEYTAITPKVKHFRMLLELTEDNQQVDANGQIIESKFDMSMFNEFCEIIITLFHGVTVEMLEDMDLPEFIPLFGKCSKYVMDSIKPSSGGSGK